MSYRGAYAFLPPTVAHLALLATDGQGLPEISAGTDAALVQVAAAPVVTGSH
jgi:hypothetical protein